MGLHSSNRGKDMQATLINFNYDPTWLKEYDFDVTIYDRSDDGVERNLQRYGKVFKTKNIGDVDYDKLGYLIEYYDKLPEVFLWGKTNLFKFISKEEFDKVRHNSVFTPLLSMSHKTYSDKFGQVCYYRDPLYYERADSWYFNTSGVDAKYFHNWKDWALEFGLPLIQYVPFAPGGNYILTKEVVHRYSRDFYEKMRNTMPHSFRPAEAQAAERSYTLLWQ